MATWSDGQCLHSEPGYVPDLLPLASLPRLRRLQLGAVELGRFPCFSSLTQVHDLALNYCDQGHEPLSAPEINALVVRGSLRQLQIPMADLTRQLILPQAQQPDNPLHTLLLSAQRGLPRGTQYQLGKLKVLALLSLVDSCSCMLSGLTELEALSLAGNLSGSVVPADLAQLLKLRWATVLFLALTSSRQALMPQQMSAPVTGRCVLMCKGRPLILQVHEVGSLQLAPSCDLRPEQHGCAWCAHADFALEEARPCFCLPALLCKTNSS